MIKVIPARTRLQAWRDASEWLLEPGLTLNLLLDIESPGSDGAAAKAAYSAIDAFYAEEGAHPLHTVAETIFPGWEYKNRGLKGVFETYAKSEYPYVAKVNRWGTYAHRMLYRESKKKGIVNPLETLIKKMRGAKEGTTPYRSCYEMSMGSPEFDIPLYKDEVDGEQRRNLPCMSHVSFKLCDNKVHLTAIYRSHDYRHKVMGNLLGLARLQACVAHEVGAEIGGMVIHSTYAWIEGGKRKFRQLLDQVKQIVDATEDTSKRSAS